MRGVAVVTVVAVLVPACAADHPPAAKPDPDGPLVCMIDLDCLLKAVQVAVAPYAEKPPPPSGSGGLIAFGIR